MVEGKIGWASATRRGNDRPARWLWPWRRRAPRNLLPHRPGRQEIVPRGTLQWDARRAGRSVGPKMGPMALPYLTSDFPGIGGTIKQRAEDFFVQEIPLYEPSGE